VEERPDRADYLAEHDRRVEEETRSERFRIDPDVLAETFSQEDSLEFEELLDLDVPEPSTGAKVGNDRFAPDRNGNMASLPSPFTLTNKDGLQKPSASSHTTQDLAGSPSNDLLREKLGDRVALNTVAVPYAAYVNRIKRLVSFYADQNLKNLPRGTRVTKPSYEIVNFVVLDGQGALESIEVRRSSGIPAMDQAIVDAFRAAGPFPNPPPQLVAPDGKVYLPTFGWQIDIGQGHAAFGPDPNAGVQYPGMLKTRR
jgi:TonB family protein